MHLREVLLCLFGVVADRWLSAFARTTTPLGYEADNLFLESKLNGSFLRNVLSPVPEHKMQFVSSKVRFLRSLVFS